MQNSPLNDSAQPFDPEILIDDRPVTIALYLAKQGLPVFPCKGSGPKVKSPHTQHGFREATCDQATIRKWWLQWPSALVGVRTGSASGIAVLDLDVKNGKDGIAAARSRGIDPDTASPLIQQTLSGAGRHLYFRHSGGQEYQQDGAAGIDVKAEGGYVIAYRPFDVPELPSFPATLIREPIRRDPSDVTASLPLESDWAEISKALRCISADCDRDTWRNVGMALHHTDNGSDRAFDIWAEWSRTALPLNTASDRELSQQWRSFGKSDRALVTLGTLFHLATVGGYERPRLQVNADDFDDLPSFEKGEIQRNSHGAPKATMHNAICYMQQVNAACGFNLRHNLMTGRDEWRGGLIQDADLTLFRVAIEQAGMHNVGGMTAEAVRAVAQKNSYHPVKEWLEGLRHDGRPRLDTWLSDYLGVSESAFSRAVGRAFLIAMVARVMRPGCKHDHVLVLAGPQGIGKSTVCQILGGQWTGDNMPSIREGAKEAGLYLCGHWLVELAELAPSRKAEAEDLKSFLTRGDDEIRAPYARRADIVPRQCVFVGTTNEAAFLRDMTGGRRFWPVTCGAVLDTVALAQDRDQLFAEAVAAFNAGEQWHLSSETERLAWAEQESVREEDPWESAIADHLDGDDEQDGFIEPVDKITARDLLTRIGVPIERQKQADMQRISRILKHRGWIRQHSRNGKVWVRPCGRIEP